MNNLKNNKILLSNEVVGLQNGFYNAYWKGYDLSIKNEKINVKTIEEIKGTDCKTTVMIIGGKIYRAKF